MGIKGVASPCRTSNGAGLKDVLHGAATQPGPNKEEKEEEEEEGYLPPLVEKVLPARWTHHEVVLFGGENRQYTQSKSTSNMGMAWWIWKVPPW